MPIPLESGMPPDTELGNGCQVIFEAISPTTGAAVSGVLYTLGTLYVDVTQGSAEALASGPYMFVPGPEA